MRPTIRFVYEWALRAFGKEHVYNQRTRALRVLEEAVELAQCCGVPREKALELILIVYKRPIGELKQELGGVLTTVNIFCIANGLDPDEVFEDEVSRVLAKPVEHFTKRNQDKVDMGLI